jgi:hypothetical protein
MWNTPPGWPSPPAGWRPLPGWLPDPAWPAPPLDWQFWVERPHRSRWLTVVLPIVVGVVLLGSGVTYLVVRVQDTQNDVRAAANRYGQALVSRNFELAGSMLCPDDQPLEDRFVAAWRRNAAAGRGLDRFRVVSVEISKVNGHQSGTVRATVYSGGVIFSELLPLVQTSGKWQPCPDT